MMAEGVDPCCVHVPVPTIIVFPFMITLVALQRTLSGPASGVVGLAETVMDTVLDDAAGGQIPPVTVHLNT